MNYFTNEKNHLILLSLLKAHGIRKVVASPGTTNISLVGSMQNDPWFEIYSSVDERSAAYIACGLAGESHEPVVLTCTGATASRNYMPGLTEAYYRKLPVLAVTSHQGNDKLGHLIAQNIDRTAPPSDVVGLSVTIPVCKDERDEWNCEIQANKALLELRRHGGIPVHINLITSYSCDFSVKELPSVRCIKRYNQESEFPDIPEGGVAVFAGAHTTMSRDLQDALDAFCATYDAVVFCDHTSGYYGKYRVNFSLVASQHNYKSSAMCVDTLIHIGEVSGDYYTMKLQPKRVWRVSEDGEIRDTFGTLECVFETRKTDFFRFYAHENSSAESQLRALKIEYQHVYDMIPDLPFGNLWMAYTCAGMLPQNAVVHLGILNTLRSWNMVDFPQGVQSTSNVGGFGIDGNISTLLGAALANPEKLFIGIVGDLSFFYDLNCWGNRHLPANMRVMLINNARGQEFCNYDNRGRAFGEEVLKFVAAGNHYGNHSQALVRHYSENLGVTYISATNKQEAVAASRIFFDASHQSAPILFEVFTDGEEENKALETIRNIANPDNMKGFKQARMDSTSAGMLRRFCSKQKQNIKKLIRG